MKRNAQLETVLEELRAANAAPIVERGRHVKVRWYAPTGELRLYVMPGSSKAWCGVLNARATVRRILKRDGMLAP